MPDSTDDTQIIWPESWTRRLDLETCFDPTLPLAIDVGCGKGRFLLARAAKHPEINYLGIERLLLRIRKINNLALRQGLKNIRLLRIEAAYAVEWLLPPACADIVYVFFPDPWPKRKHHRRRLFNAHFLDVLHSRMKAGAELHVATDHLAYFDDIHALLEKDSRYEPIPVFEPSEEEKTDFELVFVNQGAPIGRCSYRKTGHGDGSSPPLPPPSSQHTQA